METDINKDIDKNETIVKLPNQTFFEVERYIRRHFVGKVFEESFVKDEDNISFEFYANLGIDGKLDELKKLLDKAKNEKILEYEIESRYGPTNWNPDGSAGQPSRIRKCKIKYLIPTKELLKELDREMIANILKKPDVDPEKSPYSQESDEHLDHEVLRKRHQELLQDSDYVQIFEDQCLKFLMLSDKTRQFYWYYNGDRTADGRLMGEKGNETESTPSSYLDFLVGKRFSDVEKSDLDKVISRSISIFEGI